MKRIERLNAIPTQPILEYLAARQGEWTSLWNGYFAQFPNGASPLRPDEPVADVFYAMPPGTSELYALLKMRQLHRLGLVGGCPCGCRGDFEITDNGLAKLGLPRTKPYTGY